MIIIIRPSYAGSNFGIGYSERITNGKEFLFCVNTNAISATINFHFEMADFFRIPRHNQYRGTAEKFLGLL
jgi:hypothetical protein